jgi:hypothetical protein
LRETEIRTLSFKGREKNNDKKYSKKGMVLTFIIALGIIGVSFLVWFLPNQTNQNKGSNEGMIFSNPNSTLVSVKNQYNILKSEINNQIAITKNNVSASKQLVNNIDVSIKQSHDLMQTLLNGNPTQPLMTEYVELMNDIKNFSFYLGDLKNMIQKSTGN